ncbi:MAG: hypothetical protein M3Y55_05005, partial [Pseudomonadota bacterium]|nr:hypothetical protein [Pseudomonadota bacterium]
MGAISSSAATRFSRITGLSSTMKARNWIMESTSGSPSPDTCGEFDGERGGALTEGKTLARSTGEKRLWSVDEAAFRRKHPAPALSVGVFLQYGAIIFAVVVLALASASVSAAEPAPLVVGSKRFTESYILGEIVTQTLVAAGRPAVHRQGLGNTGILEQALASGSVDIYPEYTGTIVRELLKRDGNPSLDELNRWLAPRGLVAAVPLGFNNTYALAMSDAKARALGIVRISDLASNKGHGLKLGLSHEFLERADGWPALQ